MPRKIIPPEEIDEDLLRAIVGGVTISPPVSPPVNPDEMQDPQPDANPPTVNDKSAAGIKRRRVLLPDYESTFLHLTLVNQRVNVGINEDTKRKLVRVMQFIGPFHLSMGGYIDNILNNHLELFREEINGLNRERRKKDPL